MGILASGEVGGSLGHDDWPRGVGVLDWGEGDGRHGTALNNAQDREVGISRVVSRTVSDCFQHGLRGGQQARRHTPKKVACERHRFWDPSCGTYVVARLVG